MALVKVSTEEQRKYLQLSLREAHDHDVERQRLGEFRQSGWAKRSQAIREAGQSRKQRIAKGKA